MVSRDVKVGAFVLASLALIGVLVFFIGEEARMFERHTTLSATFKDVQGLTRGSPVRMGGVDIGRVVDVAYGERAEDDTIYVRMRLVLDESRRIKEDSVASVEGKGFLGDKMVVITVGSPNSLPLPEGKPIRTSESKDLANIITDLKSTVAGAERVMQNLEKTTDAFAEEEFHSDVKLAVKHLNGIVASLDEGEGYLGRLVSDPNEAERMSATVDSLRRSAVELEHLLHSTRQVVDQVKTGPGLMHQVFYGKEGERAVSQIGSAAEELAVSLHQVREGKSLAHSLLYEEESAQLVQNLGEASRDLKLVMADMKAGKGTVGALLSDPSVYEDLKILLGNVGRNRSLRALVRFSIQKDDAAPSVQAEEKEGDVVQAATETSSQTLGSGARAE